MNVKLPNGVEIPNVPDGMTKQEVIQMAIRAGYATAADFGQVSEQARQAEIAQIQQQIAAQQGPLDALAIGAGKGVTDLYRGLGRGVEALTGYQLPGSEMPIATEQSGYAALQEQRPYTTGGGEVLGQAAATFVPGLGVAGLTGRGAQIAGAGLLGSAEAGLAAAGQGQDPQEIAMASTVGGLIGSGAEYAMPVLGRLIKDGLNKLGGRQTIQITDDVGGILPEHFDEYGNIKPEVESMLSAAGLDLQALKQTAQDIVAKTPENAEQAARLKRFQEQGMPYTMGDITQTFAQKSKEARLLEVPEDPLAGQLRDIRKSQAKRIDELKNQLAEDLGTTDKGFAGANVKEALKKAKKIARQDKNEAYDYLAEVAGYEGGIPIPQQDLQERIFNNDNFQSMANALTDQERETLNRLMVQYGIETNPAAVAKYMPPEMQVGNLRPLKTGMFDYPTQVTELTTKNTEDLIKSLNAAAGPTSSPAMQGMAGILKRELDNSFDLIDETLKGNTDKIVAAAQEARELNRMFRQDFSPQSLVGKMIDTKRDGITPIIESSNIYNNLFKLSRRQSTLEPIERVVTQLNKTAEGKKALGDLRANYVLDVLDKGFAQRSDMIEGQVLFHGRNAQYQMDRLGQQEAEALFETAPGQLKKLNEILKTGEEMTPSKKEVLKGSGSVVVDLVDKLANLTLANKLPGVGPLLNAGVQIGKKSVQAGGDARELKRLFKNQPQLVKRARYIQQQMPNLAARLGISQIDFDEEQQ